MPTRRRLPTKTSRRVDAQEAEVRISHPDRILYPRDGITKRDLAEYYRFVADRMLPHISDRPLSIVRCPEGTGAACFFQKHPPAGLSQSVRRITIKEKSGTDVYQSVHDSHGLLSLVQFNAVEFHIWGSKIDQIEQPDRIVFDLDPDAGLQWSDVVEAARLLRRLLDKLGLPAYLKTTGGKGLHVVTPIRPEREWDEVKEFCRNMASLVMQLRPDRYVVNMSKAKRRGKIFIDYLRNERGSTWVAPYSARAREHAPISTPIDWKELGRVKSSATFTLQNLTRRLKSRRSDPWKDIARAAVSLTDAMLRSVRS